MSAYRGAPANSAEADAAEKPLWRTVAVWLLLAAVVGLGVFYLLARLQSGSWTPWEKKQRGTLVLYDLARSAATITGLLGASVAAGIATRRQKSHERSVEIASKTQLLAAKTHALELDRAESESVRQLRDRYASAAGQLGAEASAIRLAGIYAMAALADDWLNRDSDSQDAQACIDVLCAYLRTPPRDADEDAGSLIAAEREVRRTIVRVATQHLQPDARSSWSEMRFDFGGTVFDGDFSFANARFSGSVSFAGAVFAAGSVSFDLTRFATTGHNPTNFNGVQVRGHVSFTGSEFARGLLLDNAVITGGGKLVSRGASFSGPVSIMETRVDGGILTFDGATFASNATVQMSAAIVYGGLVSFKQTVVTGTRFDMGPINIENSIFSMSGSRLANSSIVLVDIDATTGTMDFSEVTLEQDSTLTISQSMVRGASLTFGGLQMISGRVALIDCMTDLSKIVGPWGTGFTGAWPIPPSVSVENEVAL